MARISADAAGSQNACAFLDMLRASEIGPALLAASDDGYNVLVGSTPRRPLLFTSYATHPNVFNRRLNSTAAGGYQLLNRYWAPYRDLLRLPDFSPESQDRIALQQIRERGALKLVHSGHFSAALAMVCKTWASLPGAGYDQPENDLAVLRGYYLNAGGVIA